MKTKHEFLLQLRHFMTYRFSIRDICDTLEDFNGFFDMGINEGKTEEELCLSFGNPKDIAKQMMLQASKPPKKLSFHMLMNLVLTFFTCAFSIWILANSYRIHSLVSFSCVPILSFAAILLSESRTFPANTDISRRTSRIFLFLQIFSCFLAAGLAFFIWNVLSFARITLPAPSVGIFSRNICLLFMVFGILLFFCGLGSFFHGTCFSFGPTLQGIGLIGSSWSFLNFLHRLDASFVPPISLFYPLGLSFFLSILYYIFATLVKSVRKRTRDYMKIS